MIILDYHATLDLMASRYLVVRGLLIDGRFVGRSEQFTLSLAGDPVLELCS